MQYVCFQILQFSSVQFSSVAQSCPTLCDPMNLLRMDWLDLLAVQGTLKSLSNTTVQKHQFFSAQPSSQSNSHIHT